MKTVADIWSDNDNYTDNNNNERHSTALIEMKTQQNITYLPTTY